ncbi:MAG: O-antigen ligase family protein, partial [Prevotellaceae bacterium]|nr:O-antigen ligase family protein [Prevotellaceae bacterium]
VTGWGVLGLTTTDLSYDYAAIVKNIIFCIIQCFVFFTLGLCLLRCNQQYLCRSLEKTVPFITLPPLFFFIVNAVKHFGERNIPRGQYTGIYLGHDGLPRAIGFVHDPNYFALKMLGLLLIFMVIGKIYKFKKKTNVFLLMGLLDVLLTTSRAAMLVILMFIALCGLFKVLRVKKILVFCVLAAVTAFAVSPKSRDIVLSKISKTDGSIEERGTVALIGLKAAFAYPAGVGIGNTQPYYLKEYGAEKIAHNDWVEVLVECGILGLLTYLAIFIMLLYLCKNKLARICILCFMLHLCTLSSFNYEPIIPAVLTFMCYFAHVLPNRKTQLS